MSFYFIFAEFDHDRFLDIFFQWKKKTIINMHEIFQLCMLIMKIVIVIFFLEESNVYVSDT